MAPSSAAVERIFSLCNHVFGDAQLSERAADYVQGSLMLRANKRSTSWTEPKLLVVATPFPPQT